MIPEIIMTVGFALGLGGMLGSAVSVWQRKELARMEIRHDITQEQIDRLEKQLEHQRNLASQCRDSAPDNSVHCNSDIGHFGLHTNGKRWWYGNVWFPKQLENVHEK